MDRSGGSGWRPRGGRRGGRRGRGRGRYYEGDRGGNDNRHEGDRDRNYGDDRRGNDDGGRNWDDRQGNYNRHGEDKGGYYKDDRRGNDDRGRHWDERRGNDDRGAARDEYGNSMSAGKAKYGNRHKRDHSGERGGGRGRPPPGLRGKAIGLWYASRQKEKTKEDEKRNTTQINIDSQQERHLTNLLANIRSSETCPTQPSRSYADPFEDEEIKPNEQASNNQKPDHSQDSSYKGRSSYAPKVYSDMKNDQSKSTGSYYPSRESSLFDNNAQSYGERPYSSYDRNPSQPSTSSACKSESDAKYLYSTGYKSSAKGGDLAGWGFESGSDSDSDLDDEKLYKMTQEMEQKYHGAAFEEDMEDMEEAMDFELNLYDNEEKGDSEFLFQFLKHNAANRRSLENLNADVSRDALRLQRQPDLDQRLLSDMQEKQHNPRFQEMFQFRKKLPSFKMKNNLLDLIHENQVVVISGETGCGKTTQVTQFILDDYIERGEGSLCRVVCTQPRRISAISVAERVADERAEPCGSRSVGYQIRLDSKLPREQGSILYCTTGIMLKWLESDDLLSGTSHVILDEIHERDILSDFLMIILKDMLPRRPGLKLILMSATLNAEQFSQYYNGCPMVNIPGFTYPVKEYLLEDIIPLTGYQSDGGSRPPRISHRQSREKKQELQEYQQYCDGLRNRQLGHALRSLNTEIVDTDLCADITLHIIKSKPPGAVLIFVPGWSDIKAVNDKIDQRLIKSSISKSSVRLIPLHSLMPTVNQREVFSRPPDGVRKVIVATNIAETSITIDDIVYVVDSGKIKMKNFDAENNVQTLMAEWVSHANAKQRRGRAGRVQPGECYHLYTAFHESRLQDYQLPEMLRTRLEELCLQVKIMKLGLVEPFVQKAMQPPSMAALKQSLDVLRDLNALDEFEDLTPLGYHLAKMPVDPHSGKMLLYGAMFSCVDPIMTIAASLSFKDAFYVPMGKEKLADAKRRELAGRSQSDHIMLVNAYKGWERAKYRGTMGQYCHEYFLSRHTLQMLADMRRQFATLLHEMKFIERPDPKCTSANRNSGNIRLLKAIVCAGLFPNVARVTKVKPPNKEWQATKLKTKTDKSVVLHPKSVNSNETDFTSQWVVYHLKMKINKVCLFDSTVVSPLSMLFFGGELQADKQKNQQNKDPSIQFVNIGGHVTMQANQKTCHLVKRLREEFDNLLEYKISHPGITNWDNQSKEGALLWAITELIENEIEQPPIFGRGMKDKDKWNRTCDSCGEKGHVASRCRIQNY